MKETFDQIFNLEVNSYSIYSYIYESNNDCFSNIEYLNWYNHSKRKLEMEIAKQTEGFIEGCEMINEKFTKSLLENNYSLVDIAASQSMTKYFEAYKDFLDNYSKECTSSMSLYYLIDFLDLKRGNTIKTLIKTISDEKKRDQNDIKLDFSKLKQEISIVNKKIDSFEEKFSGKEDEINDVESEILKQNRKIHDLQEQISKLENEYASLNERE